VPSPIYLPILISESCTETSIYTDVVLVLDMSTSMDRPVGSTGTTKLAGALSAATSFLDRMDFTPDDAGRHDRVAVVGFNDAAWIELPLSSDQALIRAAILDLPNKRGQGTRLDLAFQRGAEALVGHAEGSTPVVVFLTDGLPNRVPPAEDGRMETTVLRAAEKAKDAGIRIYTVGLGLPTDIDPVLLRDCATNPSDFFYTPDPDELGQIYTHIAYTFGCPK
jgi:Ca-activated chloride channel family protein